MGQMRFVIPRPERVVAGAAELIYLAGAEGIPWECRTTLGGGAMIVERDTRESGYLYAPWNVPGRGLVQLCSGSLMERLKAYNLPVELARGTLNRLRNQASQWQMAGMVVPAPFFAALHAATTAFAKAATGQDDPPAAQTLPDRPFGTALEAADSLALNTPSRCSRSVARSGRSSNTLLGAMLRAPLHRQARAVRRGV
jgi:hypothetical protein